MVRLFVSFLVVLVLSLPVPVDAAPPSDPASLVAQLMPRPAVPAPPFARARECAAGWSKVQKMDDPLPAGCVFPGSWRGILGVHERKAQAVVAAGNPTAYSEVQKVTLQVQALDTGLVIGTPLTLQLGREPGDKTPDPWVADRRLWSRLAELLSAGFQPVEDLVVKHADPGDGFGPQPTLVQLGAPYRGWLVWAQQGADGSATLRVRRPGQEFADLAPLPGKPGMRPGIMQVVVAPGERILVTTWHVAKGSEEILLRFTGRPIPK